MCFVYLEVCTFQIGRFYIETYQGKKKMKLGFYCISLFSFKAEHTLEQNNRLPFKMIMIISKPLFLQ